MNKIKENMMCKKCGAIINFSSPEGIKVGKLRCPCCSKGILKLIEAEIINKKMKFNDFMINKIIDSGISLSERVQMLEDKAK